MGQCGSYFRLTFVALATKATVRMFVTSLLYRLNADPSPLLATDYPGLEQLCVMVIFWILRQKPGTEDDIRPATKSVFSISSLVGLGEIAVVLKTWEQWLHVLTSSCWVFYFLDRIGIVSSKGNSLRNLWTDEKAGDLKGLPELQLTHKERWDKMS